MEFERWPNTHLLPQQIRAAHWHHAINSAIPSAIKHPAIGTLSPHPDPRRGVLPSPPSHHSQHQRPPPLPLVTQTEGTRAYKSPAPPPGGHAPRAPGGAGSEVSEIWPPARCQSVPSGVIRPRGSLAQRAQKGNRWTRYRPREKTGHSLGVLFFGPVNSSVGIWRWGLVENRGIYGYVKMTNKTVPEAALGLRNRWCLLFHVFPKWTQFQFSAHSRRRGKRAFDICEMKIHFLDSQSSQMINQCHSTGRDNTVKCIASLHMRNVKNNVILGRGNLLHLHSPGLTTANISVVLCSSPKLMLARA